MCIKGKKGIKFNKIKSLINKFEYFFAEDQARYIVEISKENFKKVDKILNENSVHFDQLGLITEKNITLDNDLKLSVDDLSNVYKNWLKNYMVN